MEAVSCREMFTTWGNHLFIQQFLTRPNEATKKQERRMNMVEGTQRIVKVPPKLFLKLLSPRGGQVVVKEITGI